MRNTLVVGAVAALLVACVGGGRAQSGTPGCCGPTIAVQGEIQHHAPGPGVAIVGATEPQVGQDEVFGKTFSVVLSGLPAGRYTVEVELVETYHRSAGMRSMDIAVGPVKLAEDLDLYKAAGGFGHAMVVKGEVEHKLDAVGGPLKIDFTTRKDNAMFNAVRVRDADGKVVVSLFAKDAVDLDTVRASAVPDVKEPAIYMDAGQPMDARIDDLIRRMSLREKVGQLVNDAPGIERLGVPPYNYWNECLHGVARAGIATVFPQAIGMSAMWDTDLMGQIGGAIGREGRAKYNDAIRHGNHGIYYGLTFWTPNINIFRDPRWGRGQETYGEDPYLTGRTAVAFIRGLQGNDPRYMLAMGCAKHFAVHSGPEAERHVFDAKPSERDLYETYLPQFEAAVREGWVGGVMGAYNAVDGEPACSSTFLLTDILRKKWGFGGYVTSDCGAITDIWANHKAVATRAEASARAVKAGCDIECGGDYHSLVSAVAQGLIPEKDVDQALHHVLWTRFRLGLFDPADKVPFSTIPMTEVDSPAHAALALKAARESIVLLKNTGVLPLDTARVKRIAVVGGNAASLPVLLGNYNGTPSHPVTILQGIREAVPAGVEVAYAPGGPLALRRGQTYGADSAELKAAVDAARAADVVIYVGGINGDMEGEEGAGGGLAGFVSGDRAQIELPAPQMTLLQALAATGKPLVFVNCSGSAMAFPWAAEHVPAIVQAWYPGESGGTAVADVLFGRYNPAGRLPVTFYASTADLPDFRSYDMTNRTYRYFTGKPLYAFGHGLSYTTFRYADAKAPATVPPTGTIRLTLNVANTGKRDGEEVVQVYARPRAAGAGRPLRSLCAFRRVAVPRGRSVGVDIEMPASVLRRWDSKAQAYVVDPGAYELQIGGASDETKLRRTVTVR